MTLALIGPLGLPELLIVLFILILIFGAKRLGGLGKGLGQSVRGFKEEMKQMNAGEGAKPDEGAAVSPHRAER